MLPRERVLETLLELSDRSSGRSAEALIEKALRAALVMIECDGVVALAARGRRPERMALLRGETESRTLEAPRVAVETVRAQLRSGRRS
jgi:hypothetical protein